MTEIENSRKSTVPSMFVAIAACLFVLLLWGGNYTIAKLYIPLSDRGTFGDMFGAVNSLFTGLAFAALIYAVHLQRREVSLLTQELQGNKTLWLEQQKATQEQLKLLHKQQFESTFFNLLRIFCDIVENIDLRSGGSITAQGKDVFPIFLQRIRTDADFKNQAHYKTHPRTVWAEDAYSNFYNETSSDLGHYFRTLYNLYKFVNESDLPERQQRIYTNLIRAQLSDAEATLLFLNGLSPMGAKFRDYLEKYAALKNVNKNDTLYKNAKGKNEYSPSAFE